MSGDLKITAIVVGLEPELEARVRGVLDRANTRDSHDADEFMYDSFFSLLLNAARPEDIALAGPSHHLGLARLPEDLMAKPWDRMTPEEQATYAHRPEFSLKMVKDQRLVLARRATRDSPPPRAPGRLGLPETSAKTEDPRRRLHPGANGRLRR